MFGDLKPYPEYRSLQPGGTVPAHWGVRALRSLVTPRTERNRPHLPLLSVARERGVFVRTADDANHNVIPEDLTNYKVARGGDLVINKMKAWQGSLGLAPCDGLVSPAYFVYRFSLADRFYGQALLRSRPYVAHFAAASDGVRVGQWDLSIPRLREVPVLEPPIEEQATIVRYLVHANKRIDQAIAIKRKLIQLLEEQKQVIINQVLSVGLDANVPRKYSGVPWLGNIPVHWEVRRAKYLFSDVDDRSTTGDELRLSVSHLTGVTPSAEKSITMFEAASYVGHKLCNPGDLVVNTMWAWMGALGSAHVSGIVSPAYNVYRPLRPDTVSVDFIAYLLRSASYISYFRSESTGVRPSRLRFYPDQMFAMPVVEPPQGEQLQIVSHIGEATRSAATAIDTANREIKLLREFRTRLTADVVTGQLDIREIAATLPDLDPDELVGEDSLDTAGDDDLDEVADEYVDES